MRWRAEGCRNLAKCGFGYPLEREYAWKQLHGHEGRGNAYCDAASGDADGCEHFKAVRRNAACAHGGGYRGGRHCRGGIVRLFEFRFAYRGGSDSRDIRLRARRGDESCELYRDGDARAYRHDYEERDGDLRDGGERIVDVRRRGALEPHMDGDKS